jgi:hypothetical protein
LPIGGLNEKVFIVFIHLITIQHRTHSYIKLKQPVV